MTRLEFMVPTSRWVATAGTKPCKRGTPTSIRARYLLNALLAIAAALAGAPARAESWKPAAGPLMTRWAKDVSPTRVHPEYPRPQMVRKRWMNLNGLWQLEIGGAQDQPPIGRTLPDRILVPFPVESALSGVMRRAERLWYRREFRLPADWSGKHAFLHFDAVDWEATVYLNGSLLGTHRGGYDGFTFDITAALRPSGAQELVVGVFDPADKGEQPRGKQVNDPKGIYYTPSTGIWQSVWLEPVPASHIEGLIVTPDVDHQRVRVRAAVTGPGGEGLTLEVAAEEEDRSVSRARGSATTDLELPVPRPRLWSPAHPFLYGLTVSLKRGGETIDRVESYFGMRKIELASDGKVQRLRLNDEFVFQVGVLDQGFWPDGLYTAPTDEALRSDIEAARSLGLNMIRKHVKVEPDRWYYWADRQGMLVWQDMPSGNNRTPESRQQFELELQRMIEGRRNHPSIIMWVVFNEGWGQHDTARLTQRVKELDPTRLVDNASGWTDMKVGDVIDAHHYPDPRSPVPEPSRAAVLGEFGGLGLPLAGHTWTERNWGYQGMSSREQLTTRYESLMRRVWQYRDSPGLCAVVYTQITDVETEVNGLLTYDRAVIKVDASRVAAANRGRVPAVRIITPTSREQPVTWSYAFSRPAEGWFRPEFDDSGWQSGPGGFGTAGTPGAVVRTVWNTPDIWLRRKFALTAAQVRDLFFSVHHDEDVEIYVNGVLAARAGGYTTDYEELTLTDAGRAALRAGSNTMAVHCHQTGGGQYIDVGLIQLDFRRGAGVASTPRSLTAPVAYSDGNWSAWPSGGRRTGMEGAALRISTEKRSAVPRKRSSRDGRQGRWPQ